MKMLNNYNSAINLLDKKIPNSILDWV